MAIEDLKNQAGLKSNLPVTKLEFTDGQSWYSLASENFVNAQVKSPVAAATINLLEATYSNGSNGVGASLTSTDVTFRPLIVDGITLNIGDRFLVKNQTDSTQNGVYVLNQQGDSFNQPWIAIRATDFDSPYLITMGSVIVVTQGTKNAVSSWMVSSASVVAVGTSAIQFSSLTNTGAGINDILGTANQITVQTAGGTATLSFADNPVFTGNASITIPVGSTAQRPTNLVAGMLRLNTGQ